MIIGLVILLLTHAFMGLFLVVELECSSLLAWAVVATCSRCSIFLMLHNTRTRYTWHEIYYDSVPELVVTSLYVHDGVNIFHDDQIFFRYYMDLLATCGNINIQSALLRSEDLILLHHLRTGPSP